MLGVELALPAAVFILAVSGLTGGISFLPAGTGAVETTMVGLLLLSGVTLPNALAITLIARLATLWLWVALGLAVAFVLRLPLARLAGPLSALSDGTGRINSRLPVAESAPARVSSTYTDPTRGGPV
jgi:Lysylphosphatidylglycerol synthase TM region